MGIILPVSLVAAAAAALINLWLAMRVGRLRTAHKILIGDGGNQALVSAMRAHANFVEYTPFVIVLLALIELAAGTTWWLWATAAVYLAGRIAHALGMAAAYPNALRMAGTVITLLTLLGLAIAAIAIPYLAPAAITATEMVPPG